MKKVFALLLTLTMAMSLLAGCGSKEETPAEDTTGDTAQEESAGETALSGSVSTNGSTSMEKVIGVLSEQFMADKEVKYDSDTRRALNRIKEAARADLYEESLAAEIEAIEAGIRDDKATNLQTYKREIMETLNGAVILRYSYAEGVTEHTLTEDREVHRAVALLDDGKEYARILHEQDTVRK